MLSVAWQKLRGHLRDSIWYTILYFCRTNVAKHMKQNDKEKEFGRQVELLDSNLNFTTYWQYNLGHII